MNFPKRRPILNLHSETSPWINPTLWDEQICNIHDKNEVEDEFHYLFRSPYP